jgi:hypothetical protein
MSSRREWLIVLQIHTIIVVGIVLIIIKASALMSSTRTSDDKTFIDAGFALLCVAWAAITTLAIISLGSASKTRNEIGFIEGTKVRSDSLSYKLLM